MSDSQMSPRWVGRGNHRKSRRIDGAKSRTMPDEEALMASAARQKEQGEVSQSAPIHGTCIHAVNGVELIADPSGVIYWPATDTLLVADLHLEKGSSYARRGQLLPPYDTQATLRRLDGCIEKWCPKRVVALGDSFHDREASARLSEPSLHHLMSMMAGRSWIWITGNHDPEPPVRLGGDVCDELREGGLVLRHEPQIGDAMGEIAGHLHPKARIVRRGRSVRRSCFAASRSRMILPSFGAYTGGLSVFDPAFDGLFTGNDFHALMRGSEQVYRICAADLSRATR